MNPLIVRLKSNGRYELISGHRRKKAMESIGISEAEVYVKKLSDEEATIEMVDSNMYREKVLPSEKDANVTGMEIETKPDITYDKIGGLEDQIIEVKETVELPLKEPELFDKMKLEALKHQGKSLSPKGTKSHSVDEIDDTKTQIYRYVRLTYLIPELLQLVDDTVLKDKRAVLTMGLKPAVELSYLTKEEQKLVYMGITYEDLTPSHAQTIEIRKLSKSKKLDFNSLEDILCQKKGNQNDQISFNKDKIESVLPTELLKRDKRYIERYIIKAIIEYKKMKIVEEDELDF